MQIVTINDDNISDEMVEKSKRKARAILLQDDKILISNSGGVILLPGGAIDQDETPEEAIIRELKEETGTLYDIKELKKILTIKYYQYKYPSMYNGVLNRLITTDYFIGFYQGIDLENVKRSEREMKGNFHTQLITLDDLIKTSYEKSENPRKKYFDRENQEVVKVLKRII